MNHDFDIGPLANVYRMFLFILDLFLQNLSLGFFKFFMYPGIFEQYLKVFFYLIVIYLNLYSFGSVIFQKHPINSSDPDPIMVFFTKVFIKVKQNLRTLLQEISFYIVSSILMFAFVF